MLTTAPPAERFVAERNPYFHRVDAQGPAAALSRPLHPGGDRPASWSRSRPAPARPTCRRGTSFFKDYTFLKESEARSGLRTLLWPEGRGAHLALYPNLNAADPVWRGLFRDRRFREALSLGIDRDAISQYLYFGLARPSNNTIMPESPLYREEYAAPRCTAFDPEAANRLLDELGLDKRNGDGVRLLPDGRPMELVVETAGEDTEQTDILELVRDQWAAIGFKIHTQAVRARGVAQPDLLGRGLDVDLLRHRQRHADRDSCRPRITRRRARPTSRNGRNGASTTRPRGRPARRRTCPRPSG